MKQQREIKVLQREQINKKEFANNSNCDKFSVDVHARIDDALRRLNEVAKDLKEIRRQFKAA